MNRGKGGSPKDSGYTLAQDTTQSTKQSTERRTQRRVPRRTRCYTHYNKDNTGNAYAQRRQASNARGAYRYAQGTSITRRVEKREWTIEAAGLHNRAAQEAAQRVIP